MVLTLSNTERSRLRIAMVWLLQLGLMFDIPGLTRRAGLQGTPSMMACSSMQTGFS
jgi:hypothetical protein